MNASHRCAAFALLATCALAPAFAAESAAQAAYQKERAACIDGRTGQSRADCLKEAGAALAEARRGRLGNGEGTRALAENSKERCRWVKAEDRDDCQRMAQGEGKVSGSVESGAVRKLASLFVRSTLRTPMPSAVSTPAVMRVASEPLSDQLLRVSARVVA